MGKIKANHLLFSPWKAMVGASWFTLTNVGEQGDWEQHGLTKGELYLTMQPGCLLW